MYKLITYSNSHPTYALVDYNLQFSYVLFAKHVAYVRNALVCCTRGIYPKYEYLERIHFDAVSLLDDVPEQMAETKKDYSVTEGYKVTDYKEQPHTYAEDVDEK